MFVTGNSESTTYDGFTNLQESVLKVSADLSEVLDLFTPSNVDDLDDGDLDFGSGGSDGASRPAGSNSTSGGGGGKNRNDVLMNEDNLGGFSLQGNNVLGSYNIGPCWCGPSYFVDPTDGAARVVSSGANQLEVWTLGTSPAPSLTRVSELGDLTTRANGFFTSVSVEWNGEQWQIRSSGR